MYDHASMSKCIRYAKVVNDLIKEDITTEIENMVLHLVQKIINLQYAHVNKVLVNLEKKTEREFWTEQPLDIAKLQAKNLIKKFSIRPDLTFVVNQQDPKWSNYFLTGFVNSSNHLQGYGLRINNQGGNILDAEWDGEDERIGLGRYVGGLKSV